MDKSEQHAGDRGLQEPALRIAAADASRLRVLAGPGTGKSFAMKRRVARLLENGQDPSRVLAVTFTRNAAADLIDDLHGLDVPGCEKVQACTLHSFCFSLLQRQDVFTHLGRVPRPLVTFPKAGSLQFEASPMLADLIERNPAFGGKRDCTKRIRAFEAAWARLQSETPGWPGNEIDRQFQYGLIDWMRLHKAMLIGEIVPLTVRFLHDNPASNVLSAFDHIIVDEYQDLNRAEQELIDQLAVHCSVAIVGDPNQSIYSFKHANPEGIDQFVLRHQNTRDETLSECHRCPAKVVDMANAVISNNQSAQPPLQVSPSTLDGDVHIVQWQNVEEEASGIANYVTHLVSNGGFAPGSVLVLTPREQMANRIRDLLEEHKVPCRSFFHEEGLASDKAQRAFSELALVSHPEDRVALRWLLGQGSSNWLCKPYMKLSQHCKDSNSSLKEALEALESGTLTIPRTGLLVAKYIEIKQRISTLGGLSPAELVDQLFPEDEDALTILREIALLGMSGCDDAASLYEYMRVRITNPEVANEGEVRIMSLHKSKGLTSRATIVTGCSQGLIPSTSFETEEQSDAKKQEQRRLFYVAITRCREFWLSLRSLLYLMEMLRILVLVSRGTALLDGQSLASSYLKWVHQHPSLAMVSSG